MAVRNAGERGTRRRKTYRVGGDFRLGGMYLEGDPGACPPGRPRHLVNARFLGGAIVTRGGQERVNSTALHSASACIISVEDFQSLPLRLYVTLDGCPNVGSSGFSVIAFDIDQNPEGQRVQYKDTAATTYIIAKFDNALYEGVDSQLAKFVLIRAGWDEPVFDKAGATQDIPLATFSGFTVRCMAEFDGKLFIGLDSGAGASKIVTWDGLTVRDDLTGINPPLAFGVWRDRIVVGFAAATNHVRTRSFGDSPGTWTTVAPAAGTVASVFMVSYKDILYITDGGANVWSYDGTTLQIARTVVGSTMRALEAFNGFLYYGYLSSTPEGIIGQYDGTTWTDVHKNLTTQVSTLRQPRVLRAYRSAMWVGVAGSAPNTAFVYRSPLTTTSGTWVLKNTGIISAIRAINDMVVF